MLAPTPVLDAAAAKRTGIDMETSERHARSLMRADGFVERLRQIFSAPRASAALDAETGLYEGFIDDGDRRASEQIRSEPPATAASRLSRRGAGFADERLEELLLHYVARHAPEALDAEQRADWERYRLRKLIEDPELGSIQVDEYRSRIKRLRSERPDSNRLFDRLEEWLETLELDASHRADAK
jgi:exodeoxyribonuclease-1